MWRSTTQISKSSNEQANVGPTFITKDRLLFVPLTQTNGIQKPVGLGSKKCSEAASTDDKSGGTQPNNCASPQTAVTLTVISNLSPSVLNRVARLCVADMTRWAGLWFYPYRKTSSADLSLLCRNNVTLYWGISVSGRWGSGWTVWLKTPTCFFAVLLGIACI